MKRYRITALLASVMMSAALYSCGGKKSSSENLSSEAETAAADDTSQTEETTSAASQEETTAEAAATEVTSEEQPTEAPIDEKTGESGYNDSIALAQDFYNAYLSNDAEAVYDMFDEDEMNGYFQLIRDELEGKDPAEVFSREAIISAIDQSMISVTEIMDAYSDTAQDEWTVEITAADLEPVEEAQLDDFNGDLGTSYTEAMVINYIFYKDKSNDQSFTGNSSAFLKKSDGKWYLSYSSLMQSELINHIDL